MPTNEFGVSWDALESTVEVLGVGAQTLQTVLLTVVAEAGNCIFGFDVIT